MREKLPQIPSPCGIHREAAVFPCGSSPSPLLPRTHSLSPKRHFSSDSDSESESDSDSKAIVEEKAEEPVIPNSIITGTEYLKERYKHPPFDYSKAPKPFPIRTFSYKRHFSDDSDSSDFSDSSDSDSDSETIAQEPSECFMVGPSVPTSSISVQHGTKRPLEVGDEDSKPDDENEQN